MNQGHVRNFSIILVFMLETKKEVLQNLEEPL